MMALGNEAKASDLLIFLVDGVRFGLPALDVVELTMACAISSLPQGAQIELENLPALMPALEGIVNYHGEIAGVISLASRFGKKSRPLSAAEHFIFARSGKNLVALRADRVMEMTSAAIEDVELIDSLSNFRSNQKNISGAAKLSDGLLLIFDLQTFLTTSESEALAHILSLARSQAEGAT
jgi:purine-binding chemotaxis protein CheW